ncbi:signal peptidase complex subunit 2 [Aspergillus novofumigatus IBT 16806]|uniref:Signal peptidase complex subunit 2 n=1 Tax=Aspergillus novofumigatus (strain IBT 16806) TaxID=1392255 RepID=A0A2I1C093_ASPN1|nr:putative signal peptidase complex component [Aspergillus novofumigatus IBT 16806]PKX91044.1 putative signal peptidase complex component [Aspergillus novofumigatus IBT 16806]
MATSSTPKVPVYSVNDLKSTTDDALVPYLCTLPQPYTFKQDHSKSNVRFLLGYSAVAIAAFTFYADRKLGWEATTSPWVIAAVCSYFILNTGLTYWIWAVEAGEVFRGKRKSGETISIRSSLRVQYTSPSNKILQEKEIEAPFMNWFSADGTFHPEPLRRWLSTEIEVLRLAAKETERKTGGVGSVVGVQDTNNKK